MIEKRIAINSLYLFFRMILVMGVTLYTSRIVLMKLGVIDYGIYSVVGGVVSLISFINTALANGYQRFFNIALGNNCHNDLQKSFSNSLLIQVCVIAITLIICESLGLWFLNNKMTIPENRLFAANWVFQTSILIFCFALIRVPFHAIIISFEKMNVFAYLSVIEVLLQLGLVCFLNHQGGDRLIAYGNFMALVSFCIMVFYAISAKKSDKELKISIKGKFNTLKKMLTFSVWNIFGSLAHVLRMNGLDVLLNVFFSPVINAANGFASQVSSAITSLAQNIVIASRPQVMKSYAQGNFSKMLEISYTMSRYVFCFLWLMTFPIMLNIKFIYSLWLGSDVPQYTEFFTILVLINSLTDAFSSSLVAIVHATGNMRKFQLLVSSVVMSVIPISYLFLKMGYPPQAVFYINIMISICAQIVRLMLIRKIMPVFNIKVFLRSVVVRCFLLVAITTIVVYPTSKYVLSGIPQLLMLILTALGTAMFTMIVGLNKDEKRRIKSQIMKFKV